jgi:hypothetical protein
MGYLYVQGNQLSLQGSLNAAVTAVPEPETYMLMLAGLIFVTLAGRRRRT